MNKIIQRGAEAVIFIEKNRIIKSRIPKKYRIKQIDEKIRKQRTKREARILEKLSNIIPVPKLISVSEKDKKIEMELLKGEKLSQIQCISEKPEIIRNVASNISILHNNNIIHGDLTTSNMILSESKVYIIDFGLSFHSSRIEDKAVDIHLLKQALEAKHHREFEKLFSQFLKYYNPENKTQILSQLGKVEKRGRYRH
jgi:TP53 regulating kinase-like protein